MKDIFIKIRSRIGSLFRTQNGAQYKTSRRLRKLIACVIAAALIIIAIVSLKIWVQFADARFERVIDQRRGELSLTLKDLAAVSRDLSQESAGADTKLLDAIRGSEKVAEGIEAPVVEVPQYLTQLSSAGQDKKQADFAYQLAELRESLSDLVAYGDYQRNLSMVLNDVVAVPAKITDEKSAQKIARTWSIASEKIAALTVTSGELRDINMALTDQAKQISEYSNEVASFYANDDREKLTASQDQLKSFIKKFQSNAQQFQDVQSRLETRLQIAAGRF